MLVKNNKKETPKNKYAHLFKVHGEKLFDKLGCEKYLKYVEAGDPFQHNVVMAKFCLMKNYKFNSYGEFTFFFQRYGKAAKRLNPFPIKRIEATIQYLLDDKNINFKIGIETIEKYIMDVECPEEEVILILKDGEKIKDSNRLKELEKVGKIYYDNGKWYEKN